MNEAATCADSGQPAVSIEGHCAHCLLTVGLLTEEDSTELKAGSDSGRSGSRGATRFAPGVVFGDRFRIAGFAGRGGMGQIYRAFDLKLGQDVAIKFIAHERPTQEALRRFYDEVRLARQVAHPSVCRVYELMEVDDQPFIVMEFVNGENLGSLLKRMGRLPYRDALRIAREVCSGVGAAHERGVVHGDLKPANIMIDEQGHARITDFGLARLATDVSRGIIGGTLAYMAPEQLTGVDSNRSTDIYALGLVLYEIFTGEYVSNARDGPPARPSSLQPRIGSEIERVLMQCLAVDPRQRPQSARAILEVLGGGDSLDSMMLTGETPSPEYVAASRKVTGLQASKTFVLAAACAALVFLLLFLSDRLTLYGRAELPVSPRELAARARGVALPLVGAIADEGYWFEANLKRPREASIEFHYRAARGALETLRPDGILRRDDPPPIDPGMVHVVLAPDGQVLRVESPANLAGSDRQPAAAPEGRLADTLYTFVLAVAVIAGFFLARHNVRLRRIDRRGAARLAMWVFCCRAMYGLISSHHPLLIEKEAAHLAAIFGASLLMTTQVLLSYLALEPFVRRTWPALMIGWMRFGQGRFRDNVVGREVLMGTAAGLTFRLFDHARNAAPLLFPSVDVIPSHLAVDALGSMRTALGEVFQYQARAIFYSLFALFLLLLLRMLVRSDTFAKALWIVVTTAMFIRWGDLRVDIPVVALQMIVLLLILTRVGLLSLITAVFVALLMVEIPLTMDVARFYFASSSLVVVIVGALLAGAVDASVSRRWSPPPASAPVAA